MSPNLNDYRWVIVNSSGGKDSQTALRQVILLADAQGYSRERIVVSHQCLGHVEWQGARDLAQTQAEFYGLRFEVTKYRNNKGQELGLLDYVRLRGKWPSSGQRYCTSDFKATPGSRVVTKLNHEAPGAILYVKGFRSEESSARAKRVPFGTNAKLSNSKRTVTDWLPIHEWSEAQVWADIKASGVPYHKAYDLGMPRLSCVFCIFGTQHSLMTAGRANPDLLAEYVQVEKEIGHTFQNNKPLSAIQDAINAEKQNAVTTQ